MFLLIWRFVSIFILVVNTVANQLTIYQEIFKNYEKNIRPVKYANTTTSVVITPTIFVVFEMDPATESVHFILDFEMLWTDEYLNWDPLAYDDIESISVPEELIWLPDVCMVNSYQSTALIALERRKIRIWNDGGITQWNPQIVTHYCEMIIDSFPFDTQTCTIVLSPWTLSIQDIILQVQPLPLSIFQSGTFRGNPEWQMLSLDTANANVTQSNGEIHSQARMIVTLKRNSVYYICVLIVPTFVITTLCLLGIFAPFSSEGVREEKVTLGLTTLLTIAVILNAVATAMPKTSKLPLLGWFVLGELLICAVAILISVLIMFLHERVFMHHYPPPRWLSVILACKTNSESRKKPHKIQKSVGGNWTKSYGNEMSGALYDLHTTLQMVRNHIEEEKIEELIHYQWSTIIDHVDFILLVTFQLVNILGSVWLLVW